MVARLVFISSNQGNDTQRFSKPHHIPDDTATKLMRLFVLSLPSCNINVAAKEGLVWGYIMAPRNAPPLSVAVMFETP